MVPSYGEICRYRFASTETGNVGIVAVRHLLIQVKRHWSHHCGNAVAGLGIVEPWVRSDIDEDLSRFLFVGAFWKSVKVRSPM